MNIMSEMFLFSLFIVFFILKLSNIIDWSWWFVTMPLWLPIALTVILAILIAILIVLTVVFELIF